MTAVEAPAARKRAPARGGTASAVLRLARAEAWRIVRHPVHLLCVAAFFSITGITGIADTVNGETVTGPMVREGLEWFFLLYYGLVVLFGVNLVASSARRCRATELFDAAPLSGQARTAALCLAVLGPTAVAGTATLVIAALPHKGTGPENEAFTPAGLLAIPLCTLGAGLLGVAAARWLPWPGVPLAVAVVLFVLVMATAGSGWAPWIASYSFIEDAGLRGGSESWHAVYLAGLCALAALAALLRHRGHRWALLAVSALVAAATLAAGLVQLP